MTKHNLLPELEMRSAQNSTSNVGEPTTAAYSAPTIVASSAAGNAAPLPAGGLGAGEGGCGLSGGGGAGPGGCGEGGEYTTITSCAPSSCASLFRFSGGGRGGLGGREGGLSGVPGGATRPGDRGGRGGGDGGSSTSSYCTTVKSTITSDAASASCLCRRPLLAAPRGSCGASSRRSSSAFSAAMVS